MSHLPVTGTGTMQTVLEHKALQHRQRLQIALSHDASHQPRSQRPPQPAASLQVSSLMFIHITFFAALFILESCVHVRGAVILHVIIYMNPSMALTSVWQSIPVAVAVGL